MQTGRMRDKRKNNNRQTRTLSMKGGRNTDEGGDSSETSSNRRC